MPPAGHRSSTQPEVRDQGWWTGGALTALAERQDGLLTARQLHDAGVPWTTSRAWRANGRLLPVYPGVYAVGHRALSTRGQRRAALLSAGPDAALSHATALAHHGVADLRDRRTHVLVPRGSCGPRRQFVLHRTVLLDDRDVVTVDGLRCTTVARTLIDLAGTAGEAALAFACRKAEYARVLDVTAIGHTLARMRRAPGTAALRRVLAPAGIDGAILETRLEQRALDLLLAAGLPMPVTQQRFDLRPDHRAVRVDLWYPDARLVIEVDGPHHGLPLQRELDAARDTAFRRRGIDVIRITSRELDADPHAAAARVLQRWSRIFESAEDR